MMSEKERRLCPFKRRIKSSNRVVERKMIHEVSEHFDSCVGAKCMAYDNGDCRRMREKTERPLGWEETQ